MCVPMLSPLLMPALGIAAGRGIGSLLGINGRNPAAPTRNLSAQPTTKAPGPMGAGAGDDVKTKKPDESVKIQQNAKQKRDKQTVKKGLGALGAAPAINTGIDSTPSGGINTGL